MASVAQIQANRLNAQKSTGPRTAEGKEKASRNALKHGLLAREMVIAGEEPEEFELYREGMLAELAPAGVVETLLAERVVGLAWRLRRAERLQNAAFAALDEGEPTPLLEARLEEWKQLKGSAWDRGVAGVVDENAALGRMVVADFAEARVLDRLLMYERRIESSLYRTMAELRHERQTVSEKPIHRGMGLGSPTQNTALGVPFQPMNHRQDADATKPHGQDARATSHTLSKARAAAAGPEEVSRSEGRLPAGQESSTPAELASFGANAVAEGVPSVEGVHDHSCALAAGSGCGCDTRFVPRSRRAVSSSGCVGRASAPRSTLAATDTSFATATANLPAGGNQGQDAHATETPDGVTTNAIPDVPVEEQSCETNPITGGASSWKCQGISEELKGSGDVRPPSAEPTQIPI